MPEEKGETAVKYFWLIQHGGTEIVPQFRRIWSWWLFCRAPARP